MYHAFISYSHAADDRLAPALQSALHRFAKPWYRLRALRLFRDKTSLSATPGLWPVIQQALDRSEYFILLASPDAAGSMWVGREIEHWRATKPAGRMLIVLTDGELQWDDDAGDFDRETSTALPRALAGAFAEEPLWVDLRWARASEHLSLGQARYRDAVAELAATLHGRPKDEIAGEDVRQHRRARRIAWTAAGALFLLAVGLGVASWIAVGQRDRAEERGAIALSRQLATEAVALAGGERGDLALLLSLEALRVWPTVDARNGLLAALTRDERRLFHLHGHLGEITSLAFDDDGGRLYSLGCEGISPIGNCAHFGVRHWSTATGEPLGQLVLPDAQRWTRLFPSPERDGLVARDTRGREWSPDTGEALARSRLSGMWSPRRDVVAQLVTGAVAVHEAGTGRLLGPVRHSGGKIRELAFHPREPLMATAGADGEVRLWSTEALLEGSSEPERILTGHAKAVIDLDFSADGSSLITTSWDDSVLLWDLRSEAPPLRLVDHRDASSAALSPDGRWLVIAFSIGEEGGELELWDAREWRRLETLAGKAPVAISPDSRLLAAAGADGSVILRDLHRRRPLARRVESAGRPESVAFLDGGAQLVASLRDATLAVWDVDDAEPRYEPIPTDGVTLSALTSHPDGRRLAAADGEGPIQLWDFTGRPSGPARTLFGHESKASSLDFSADGRRLASGSSDGTVRLWELGPDAAGPAVIEVAQDVYSVALDASADRVAAAIEDGSVLLWELSGGAPRGTVLGTHVLQSDGMTGLDFDPSGRFLISSSLEQTQSWGLVPSQPKVRPPLAGSFVALHPSGELAALVTDGDEIQLVDVSRWRPFDATLGALADLVSDIAFSPDGRVLATAAGEELVLWDVDLESWRARACALAGRDLTTEEWRRHVGDRPRQPTCPGLTEPPAIPLDAERALGFAVRAAKLGDVAEARRLFAAAARLASDSTEGRLLNEVCWSGAQRGAFTEVLAACERAVELDPDDAGFRDSRGLARALAGDTAGAIADFRAYVAAAEGDDRHARRAARRQQWIEALEAGRNPFDEMELHWIQGEGAFR